MNNVGTPINRIKDAPEPVEVKEEVVADAATNEPTEIDEPSIEDRIKEYQNKYFAKQEPKESPKEPTREDILATIREEINKPKNTQDPRFVDFIAKGDFDGAEEYIRSKTEASLTKNFEERLTSKLQEFERNVLERAVTGVTAKTSIETKLNDIIKESPELTDFKDYIEFEAEQLVSQARNTGSVRDVQSYVAAKLDAYDVVASRMRARMLGVKGKGKQEAMKMKEKVLSTSPVSGSSVKEGSQSAATSGQASSQSTEDYIAMRQRQAARQRGLIED